MKKLRESQVISAELTFGLVLITAYQIIQQNILSPESQIPSDAPSGFTCSLVCVWFASNVKFLLFKSDSSQHSLFAHSISRLVAFLALLGARCKWCKIRGEQEQTTVLSALLLCFFVVSSLIVMALGHSHSKGSLGKLAIFLEPQRFFLQMDSFSYLISGLLWLMCPGWLLGTEIRSEENLQLYLSRAFGAMMVGDSLASFTTQSQLDTAEASVYSSRTAGTVLLLLMLVLHNQLTASSWAGVPVSLVLLAAAFWTVNSILGCLSSRDIHAGASAEKIYEQALQGTRKSRLLQRGVTL
ncbi:uncharacterized protein LOC107197187 [Astyanax mexicanus]|uniref:uncharacterized protein LOC107197187 n=1 Tax=Astyanax mexicanus TaxID=7994 RepID=UPI0020CAD1FE|nr:uncharacterized protein LOC107197187 [Astyanax mexicanus]